MLGETWTRHWIRVSATRARVSQVSASSRGVDAAVRARRRMGDSLETRMTKPESPNQIRIPNDEGGNPRGGSSIYRVYFVIRISSFGLDSDFGFRHSSFFPPSPPDGLRRKKA